MTHAPLGLGGRDAHCSEGRARLATLLEPRPPSDIPLPPSTWPPLRSSCPPAALLTIDCSCHGGCLGCSGLSKWSPASGSAGWRKRRSAERASRGSRHRTRGWMRSTRDGVRCWSRRGSRGSRGSGLTRALSASSPLPGPAGQRRLLPLLQPAPGPPPPQPLRQGLPVHGLLQRKRWRRLQLAGRLLQRAMRQPPTPQQSAPTGSRRRTQGWRRQSGAALRLRGVPHTMPWRQLTRRTQGQR